MNNVFCYYLDRQIADTFSKHIGQDIYDSICLGVCGRVYHIIDKRIKKTVYTKSRKFIGYMYKRIGHMLNYDIRQAIDKQIWSSLNNSSHLVIDNKVMSEVNKQMMQTIVFKTCQVMYGLTNSEGNVGLD